jgi:hypothetical protein
MSYHDLSSCTLDADARRAEADRIVAMLESVTDDLSNTEASFVERVADGCPISVKMLFWLRDIKDRVL